MTLGDRGNGTAVARSSKVATRVDGGWVVTSALLTAEITDDGRVLVGAISPRRPGEGRGVRQGAMTTVAAADRGQPLGH